MQFLEKYLIWKILREVEKSVEDNSFLQILQIMLSAISEKRILQHQLEWKLERIFKQKFLGKEIVILIGTGRLTRRLHNINGT